VKQSITVGTVVVALGKVAIITEVRSLDQVVVRISQTGQTHVVAVANLEVVPEGRIAANHLISYDPADLREGQKIVAAAERAVVLKEYFEGELTRAHAMEKLALRKSAFYKLVSRFNAALGALSIISRSPGPKQGRHRISPDVIDVVHACFNEHYKGKSASYSHVWTQAQAVCAHRGLPTPGLSTVQRIIKQMDPKVVFRRKHGLDAANQTFQPRPGYVHTDYPLHHAQMDHTRVDLILRAEHDRSIIIGRPWVTLLIDVHTRIILAFYLSMFPPSLISVQQTVCMAALPKNKEHAGSTTFGVTYPYYGMPTHLGMDNASEFHSPILVASLRKYGCEPLWRKIGKKHMGGTIESLIGTLMTTAVHFLPGTTFSNVEQRGEYDSEKHSTLTFKEFCSWFAGQILIYHGTVHSELRQSPKDAWEDYYSEKTGRLPPIITNQGNFYVDFLPEKHRPIRNNGITLNSAIYWSSGLSAKQGKGKVTVKFDPYDMTHIWAKIGDKYLRVPLTRSRHGFTNYEYYRADRAYNKHKPPGTVTDPEALDRIPLNNKIVKDAVKSTKESKREKTQSEAQTQHLDRLQNGVPKHVLINHDTDPSDGVANAKVNFSKPPKLFDTKD
jgi:putative transposase